MPTIDIGGALEYAVNLSIHFATDFFAFIVIAAAVAAFATFFGRDRIMPLAASLYAAIPLYLFFPYTGVIDTALLDIALYLGLALVALIAFSGLSSFIAEGSLGFVKLIVLSAAVAGMLIVVSIHVLPVEDIYMFSAPTRALFASAEAFFFWLLAPLAAIYVFGRG